MAGTWGKFSVREGGLEGEMTDFATQNLVNSGFSALPPSFKRGLSPSKVFLQGLSPRSFPLLLLRLQFAALFHHFFHAEFGVQNLLAQTDRLRRDLNQIIVTNVFDRFLQGENARRGQKQLFVRTRGTDRRQMLRLAGDPFLGKECKIGRASCRERV